MDPRIGRAALRWAARVLWILAAGGALPGTALAGKWECRADAAGARYLLFRGAIEEGEFDRFRGAFRDCFGGGYAGQRTVDLHSGGGAVVEALNIAAALVAEGSGPRPIATRVGRGSYCISACTYLFVAGRLRDVALGGSFEPHGFSAFLGARIDRAIDEARDKAGNVAWDAVELQFSRTRLLGQWLQPLAAGDERFAFAANWAAEYADPRGVRRGAPMRAAQAFAQLPPPQREFVQMLDAILATAMPELERTAALQAFAPLLASWGGQDVDTRAFDEERYFRWVAGEFEAAMRIYLRKLKDGRAPVLSQDFLAALLRGQRERASSVARNVGELLGPYLATRADQVDLTGLVKLMFSTSILYTRPLTREELCDLNIVNRDCAN